MSSTFKIDKYLVDIPFPSNKMIHILEAKLSKLKEARSEHIPEIDNLIVDLEKKLEAETTKFREDRIKYRVLLEEKKNLFYYDLLRGLGFKFPTKEIWDLKIKEFRYHVETKRKSISNNLKAIWDDAHFWREAGNLLKK